MAVGDLGSEGCLGHGVDSDPRGAGRDLHHDEIASPVRMGAPNGSYEERFAVEGQGSPFLFAAKNPIALGSAAFEEAVATWELRFGPDNRFRAFYDVQLAERQMLILAIGIKIGNQLYIGGEEVQL